MSSWKARLLIVLTLLAILVSVSAAPAMANHLGDNDCDDNGVIDEALCEDDNGDDGDVDVNVRRIPPRCAIVTVEEEERNVFGVQEEDVDVFWVCKPSLLHPGVFEELT